MALVGKKEISYTAIGKELGITRQAAKLKYDRVKEIHGEVTMALLRKERHQSPAVAERKALRLETEANMRIVRHALLHGTIHTAGKFGMEESEVEELVAKLTPAR